MNFNVYCDESCHLKNDNSTVMVLGAIWCPEENARSIARRIKEIKRKHNLRKTFEIKWTKVSASKIEFYKDCIDYFFDESDLHFRAIIVPNKDKLEHELFQQTHDSWYYKMYFNMLKFIFESTSEYKVYIDIKDTRGQSKIKSLHEILCNNSHDFSKKIIRQLQLVHSHEIVQMELADLLIGALSYVNRNLCNNKGKLKLIERIKERSGYTLKHTVLPRETKLNIFVWQSRDAL